MEGLYYQDSMVPIYNGHVLDVLKQLPDESTGEETRIASMPGKGRSITSTGRK